MTAMFQPKPPSKPAQAKSARASAPSAQKVPGDDLLPDRGHRFSTGRADCCIARAAYRVVFRTGDAAGSPAELYLCCHHYRASTAGLLERQATVYDASHHMLASFG